MSTTPHWMLEAALIVGFVVLTSLAAPGLAVWLSTWGLR